MVARTNMNMNEDIILGMNMDDDTVLGMNMNEDIVLGMNMNEDTDLGMNMNEDTNLSMNMNENIATGMNTKKFDLAEHQKGFTPIGIRTDVKETGTLYHGTKADLKVGDMLEAGYASNYGKQVKAKFIYLTATLDAAIWGAELALGEGKGRIYVVEPTGSIDDDPNLTDMRFPGNPTKSYRTKAPLRIRGEVLDWEGHAPDVIQKMRNNVKELELQGYGAI